MGRKEKCWKCDRKRSDVSLRMCDDRLCQDCDDTNRASAGLRFVEAPGQQCYRKVVDVMIISTMHRICLNSKVKECSCCTNNTSYLSYCLQTRHVCTFASSKVSDEIYFSFENERLPLQLVTIIRFVRCAISTF